MRKDSFLPCILTNLSRAELGTAVSAVESQIVGYSTRNAPLNEFRLAAVSFAGLGNENLVQEILPMTTAVEADDAGDFQTLAPHIQVQRKDSTGYDMYWYVNNAIYSPNGTWEDDDVDTKPGWVDEYGILCIPEYYDEDEELRICQYSGILTPGIGIWFKDQEKLGALVANGQVIGKDVEVTCPAEFRLRASAFPAEIKINDINQLACTGMADVDADDAGDFQAHAAHLQVQRADGSSGYDMYWYVNNAIYSPNGTWEDEDVDVKAGWADEYGILCIPEYYDEDEELRICQYPGVIPVGNGLWSNGQDRQFTMTFKSIVK